MRQFPAEKYRRTGSRATAEEYHRWVTRFFAAVGKLPADVTTPEVHGFAYAPGRSGREHRLARSQGSWFKDEDVRIKWVTAGVEAPDQCVAIAWRWIRGA
jgi:hypothetical protein